MSEEVTYFTPTVIYRVVDGEHHAAVVEVEGKGRAMFLFRDENDAEEYRLKTATYPTGEGFRPISLDVTPLREVLEWHGCNHVVIPKSLVTGEEGPDFYRAEDFLWILEELSQIEVA